MHLAKGLQFRAVVVMACDDEIIPLQERIETVTGDADLEEVYETKRHLLISPAHARATGFLLPAAIPLLNSWTTCAPDASYRRIASSQPQAKPRLARAALFLSWVSPFSLGGVVFSCALTSSALPWGCQGSAPPPP